MKEPVDDLQDVVPELVSAYRKRKTTRFSGEDEMSQFIGFLIRLLELQSEAIGNLKRGGS